MRTGPTILGVLLFCGFFLLIDIYVFTGVRASTSALEPRTRRIIHWAYWIINTALVATMASFFLFMSSSGGKGFPRSFMTFFGVFILFFVPKLVFALFLLGEDVYRLLRSVVAGIRNMTASGPGDKMELFESRRRFISTVAVAAAAVPFLGILHGMASGKFRFRVRRESVFFPDLPDAFDGFTITQLSDIHVGSFDPERDRADIRRGIALANEQNSDLFVFTGDLVNNIAKEMDPWIDEFRQLKGKHGQFSILGNHDYGDYVPWDSRAEKDANMQQLFATHASLGFRLMRNENAVIEKNGQKLHLIGVENWGSGGFKQNGDLDLALQGVPADGFKVLLSHDPSHFDEKVSQHPTHVHLTLSGHTHGAQFGVEIPGIKFSPVQFRYPHWAGLYEQTKRYIYVNRGFGFLGFPGRVGIWPEVAVITLRKGNGAPTAEVTEH
jgi:uncharacterized protein